MSLIRNPKAKRPLAGRARQKPAAHDGRDRGARREVSTEKRTIRACIVAATFAATVVMLTCGEPALGIRANDVARGDYIARADFTCEDRQVADYQRNSARRREPNCYLIEPQLLQEQQEDALGVLKRVRWGSDPAATADELAATRQINLLEPKQFQQELRALGGKVNELVAKLFSDIAVGGILPEENYKAEIAQGHEEIAVIRGDRAQPQRVALDQVLTLGSAGRDLLEALIAKTFPKQSDVFRTNMLSIVAHSLAPILKFDGLASARAREAASAKIHPPMKSVKANSVILRRNVIAQPHHIYELKAERAAYRASKRWSRVRAQKMAGAGLLLALAFWGMGLYIDRYRPELVRSNTRLFMLCLLGLGVLAIAHVLVSTGLPVVLTPVALAAIVVSLCHGERFGLGVALALALATGAMKGGDMGAVAVLGLGGMAAAINCQKIDRRTTLINIGLITGLVQCSAVWATQLVGIVSTSAPTLSWVQSVLAQSLWALLNGLAVGLLVSSTLPVIEYLFRTTTEITLLELSDLNQPALRQLMLAAPGTYHHSLMVGVLGVDAAETVGANPLLTRVGAYYHDIGKITKPEYFVENVPSGVSQHTDLAPSMSALVITAHTKDGAELADEYGLPKAVRDIILQHHGTTRVEYFYREALKDNENVEEDSFRYRGPKPQTKEAAIVMLADSVESASRVLSEPNPGRIEGLVDEIVDRKMRDGQLDESNLTFREVTQIRKCFARALTATFHSRIKYPQPVSKS